MINYYWLVPLGFVIGAYGTIIGAGGGFLLVPALLLFYPIEKPETITSISLAVVFFNALSGSLAYAHMKRINFRSGIVFSIATIPGAILGALTTTYIPRRQFDLLFGILMFAASVLLLVRPGPGKREEKSGHSLTQETIKEQEKARLFPYNLVLGAGLSTGLGYISSFLGIGAGFIYVPALVYFLKFPVHIATATSQFILMIMAFTGTVTHVFSGMFHHGTNQTVALAIGVVLGAQLGARLSERIRGDLIIRGLALALAFVGIRLIVVDW